MVDIPVRHESARGCGFRQPGGLYFVSEGLHASCGRLPLPCAVCPTCHGGIKPSRGWTWIEVQSLLRSTGICEQHGAICSQCPLSPIVLPPIEKAGLLWVGEKFYRTPHDFAREAMQMGVSRRISAIPKGVVVGETWVFLAHRKAIMAIDDGGEITYTPGIFHLFKPSRIEYVVKGTETEEELQRLVDRGIMPVQVVRQEATQGELLHA